MRSIDNIYRNVRFSLSEKELLRLDKVWKFIETLHVMAVDNFFVYQYKEKVIKYIREKFSPNKFYKYEQIINKLYWNLYFTIFGKAYYNGCKRVEKDKITDDMIGHSYTNKSLIYSEIIEAYGYLDNYTLTQNEDIINVILTDIMHNRKKYENAIITKSIKINYENLLNPYYYYSDYIFPNVNLCFYNENNKETWIKRIKKYYFFGKFQDTPTGKINVTEDNYDYWWYNLIE